MRPGPAVLAALGLAACLASLAGCGPGEACAQCGRDECRNLAVTVALDDGSERRTCCPRCALRAIRESGRRAVSLTVRDFETSRPLPVEAAVLVEGSDVAPCAADPAGPPRDERGCCLMPVYDRCSPSLLAFGEPGRARAFAAAHGGRLTTWAAVEAASGGALLQ